MINTGWSGTFGELVQSVLPEGKTLNDVRDICAPFDRSDHAAGETVFYVLFHDETYMRVEIRKPTH